MNLMKQVYQPEEVMNQLREFALIKKHTGFLFLAGKNGNGKTFIAKALYWHKSERYYPEMDRDKAIFWECCELKQIYLNNIFENGKNEKLRESCKTTELLIIDDIGANNMELKGSFSEFLFSIINHRCENKKKLGTIITTNMNGKEFGEAIGHAFLTRVASDIIIRFDEADRRYDQTYLHKYADKNLLQ